ncbi:MAG: hypothetical protein M1546_07225 [Chloroflexi bacterium]|nr:hypothetical protein [Chloroflexota bacterium]
MMSVLIALVIELPIGTNLGLLRVLWALVSGQLLATRGALIPALAKIGLSDAEVMQAWSAFANGRWETHRLVMTWDKWVRQDGHWESSQYGGYRVKAVDLMGFFRPCLKHCPTTHYDSAAGKALKAIPLGIVGDVGRIGTQRFTLPCALVRAEVDPPSEALLEEALVRMAVKQMAADEALTADRGFKPVTFVKAGCTRVVLRRPKNFTARRRTPPPYGGHGRKPSRPAVVRPLPRTYRGKTIAATLPDRIETWVEPESNQAVTAQVWLDVVLPDQPKRWDAPTRRLVKDTPWMIVVIFHPRFAQPMLLIVTMTVAWSAQHAQAFYLDRWGIEHPPLVAKQLLGAHRQFVFADQARQRLPELSVLAGSVLSYIAASQDAIPTGFWDRAPKSTPGRLRRLLTQLHFPADFPLPERLREKRSRTDHLPKGILAHRRTKQAVSQPAVDSPDSVCPTIQT